MMSRTFWRAASQCVTGSQNPCARWKEMSYGEVVISERSFYGYRFFLQPYRGHKLFETVQIVHLVVQV